MAARLLCFPEGLQPCPPSTRRCMRSRDTPPPTLVELCGCSKVTSRGFGGGIVNTWHTGASLSGRKPGTAHPEGTRK